MFCICTFMQFNYGYNRPKNLKNYKKLQKMSKGTRTCNYFPAKLMEQKTATERQCIVLLWNCKCLLLTPIEPNFWFNCNSRAGEWFLFRRWHFLAKCAAFFSFLKSCKSFVCALCSNEYCIWKFQATTKCKWIRTNNSYVQSLYSSLLDYKKTQVAKGKSNKNFGKVRRNVCNAMVPMYIPVGT